MAKWEGPVAAPEHVAAVRRPRHRRRVRRSFQVKEVAAVVLRHVKVREPEGPLEGAGLKADVPKRVAVRERVRERDIDRTDLTGPERPPLVAFG